MKEPTYTVWLEFEEWQDCPLEDIEDGYFNAEIRFFDGSCIGLNIWTYKFFLRHLNDFTEQMREPYVVLPDLLVKRMCRTTIETSIDELIRNNHWPHAKSISFDCS